MANYYTYRLMNKITGETFDIYAISFAEARSIACEVKGGKAEEWIDRPVHGFYC